MAREELMLDAYFVDAITLVRSNGYDKWGEPLATTSVSFSGYIERKTRLVRNFAGEQVVSSAMIYCPATLTITHEDKMNFDGADHVILNIVKQKDFSATHIEVFVA
jgi:hypothetical protein